jgi:Cyclin, N-terminal domain
VLGCVLQLLLYCCCCCRYFARVQTSRKNYQLLGATCLHIASKCEDVSYIGIDDLALCADKVCICIYERTV